MALLLVLATGLALTAASAGAAVGGLPTLPVTVDFVPYGESELCRSLVPKFLQAETFRALTPRGRPAPGSPLTATCATAQEKGLEVLVVGLFKDGVSKRIRLMTIPSSDPAAAAELAAATFAEDDKIVDAALERYLAENAAAGGSSLESLHELLESDSDPARAHYALFELHAAAGKHPVALWHYNAYLLASKADPSKAPQADIDRLDRESLRGLALGTASEDTSEVDAAIKRWAKALDAKRPDLALGEIRFVSRVAPWSPWAYERLAAVFDEMGWKRLAKHWKARGRFAKKVNTSRRLHKALLERLIGD